MTEAVHPALYEALCACLGLDPSSVEAASRIAPAYAEAITNITYVSDPGTIPGPDDPEEPDSPDKNGGIDGLDLIDDTWN